MEFVTIKGLYISCFTAGMTLFALLAVIFFFRSSVKSGEGKSISEILRALGKAVSYMDSKKSVSA